MKEAVLFTTWGIVGELVPVGLLIFRGTLEQLHASHICSLFLLPGRGGVREHKTLGSEFIPERVRVLQLVLESCYYLLIHSLLQMSGTHFGSQVPISKVVGMVVFRP